jgi:hypothetical protein
MLPFMTIVKSVFTFITKNWGWIASVGMVLGFILFFKQCQSTKFAKAQTEAVKQIADNNIKALKDSSIVLMVTREQLAIIDKNLSKVTHELDSLKKHPKTIVITKPVYIPKDVKAANTLVHDSVDLTKYGLAFNSWDSVRTIVGTSWFKIIPTDTAALVKPDTTVIHKFTLNFGLAIAKYDDKENKMTRLDVTPYYVNEQGEYTTPISPNLLKMQFRGADLLDVPYVPTDVPCPSAKHKYSLKGGFTASLNLIGYGYMPDANKAGVIAPSVNLGYGFTLVRNR